MKNIIFPEPAYYEKIEVYQDINNDKNLQKTITNYFYKKLTKYINIEKKYLYKHLAYLNTRYNINWYDMRLIHKKKIISYIMNKHNE